MANLGVQVYQTGAPREVLDAQVQRGFAFVEEKCMEELLTSRGKVIPEGDEEDNNWKTELTMACLAAIKPDMTDTEAAACIARGFVDGAPKLLRDLAGIGGAAERRVQRGRSAEDRGVRG